MRKRLSFELCAEAVLILSSGFVFDEHKHQAIGSTAPEIRLHGVDGKIYTLESFKSAKVLVIVFMCNHCPTSQAYEPRIIKLDKQYGPKGVQVVGVGPGGPAAGRGDELGYS